MSNTISIKFILSQSIKYFGSNIKDLSILCFKASVVMTALSIVNSAYFDQTSSIDVLRLIINSFASMILTFGISIIIIREIIIPEISHQGLTKTIFSRATLNMMIFSAFFIIIASGLIGIPVLLKIKFGGIVPIFMIALGCVATFILYIRFASITADIAIKNAIQLRFNWTLTKNNFFKISILGVIVWLPHVILSTTVIIALVIFNIINDSMQTPLILFDTYSPVFSSLLYVVMNSMTEFFLMLCNIFVIIVSAKLYVELINRQQRLFENKEFKDNQ